MSKFISGWHKLLSRADMDLTTLSEIDLWTYNTPSVFFGIKNIDHSKNMYEVIRENAIPNNFCNDGITFFNENFSIESSTIVNNVINGLNNNFIFWKRGCFYT